MAIRMTGLVSGLDTEAIIEELMSAQKTKTTKLENKITKLEWKQEKWKGLNTKIYSFYTGSLSKARFQSNYQTKKATSSNETKLGVTANSSATKGTHNVQVKELASAQFVTGKELASTVTETTKLSELGIKASEGSTIQIASGDKSASLDVGANTTIADFVQSCKDAGINATFDANQKRFFLSSSDSGTENAFTITMSNSADAVERNDIRQQLGYDGMSSSDKSTVNNLLREYKNDTLVDTDRDAIYQKLKELGKASVTSGITSAYKADAANVQTAKDAATAELRTKYGSEAELDEKELNTLTETKLATAATEYAKGLSDAYDGGSATAGNPYFDAAENLSRLLNDYKNSSSAATSGTNSLASLGLCEIKEMTDGSGNTSIKASDSSIAFVGASDCTIIYNGAEIKNNSNTITANGLTFTAKQVTDTNEVINISIGNDTQGVYDMVKGFVKDYNELLKEMNTLYNADASRDYDPLTDDQKEAMSDKEIENWENKIKDSLLRRDDQLSGVISAMRSAMSGSVEVGGKSYSLASFGIATTDYTEKGLLHIDGNSDDSSTASNEDKLMKAIEKNPDVVAEVISKLSQTMYSSITDKMSTSTLSSALTVYNDKEMKSQLTDYKSDLSDLEDKLKEIEDRYYKQFSAMETALSKLNSQSNSLASIMGTNN